MQADPRRPHVSQCLPSSVQALYSCCAADGRLGMQTGDANPRNQSSAQEALERMARTPQLSLASQSQVLPALHCSSGTSCIPRYPAARRSCILDV